MKFLTILFLLFAQVSLSQTNLDKLCFEKINRYRKSFSKNEFIWNDIAFKASNHHSNYLKDSCDMTVSHHESILVNPQDRLWKYGSNCSRISENVLLLSMNFEDSESKENINSEISTGVFESWKNSPGHNKTMLNECRLGGVSTVIQKQPTGIEGFTNYLIWATLVIYNP